MTAATPATARSAFLERVHENIVPILLIGLLAIVLLLVFASSLIVSDTWMTLMAGREVVHNGLPDLEWLTVQGTGHVWTDQQWLSQVLAYRAWQVGGLSLVILGGVVAVTLAFSLGVAAARRRGGTPLACAIVLLFVIACAPWAWTTRAQVLSLPLYVGTLWLAVAARQRLTPQIFVSLPLLVLWANLHGSVTLGATIVVLAGLLAIARRGSTRRERGLGGLLVVGAVAAVFVTPYSPRRIYDYYHLFFVDPPFEGVLNEWERTRVNGTSAMFWLICVLTVPLVIRYRHRLSLLEWLVLAVTFVGGLQAIRGIVWFALALLVILPNVLTGLLGQRSVLAVKPANLALAGLLGLGVLGSSVALLTRSDASLSAFMPNRALPLIARELRDPQTLVFGTDRHADWLLWKLPQIRGRIAFDVRFELYTREQIEDTVRWNGRIGADWKAVADPYRVVLLDTADRIDHLPYLRAEPGTHIVFRDASLIVAVRPR